MSTEEFLRHVYDGFNARDIEAVLGALHPDVMWANGMRGRARARPGRRAGLLDPPVGDD